MKKSLVMAPALAALFLGAAANAHPGPKLLTTGNGERTAMTPGMSYQDIEGVHFFEGSHMLAGAPEEIAPPQETVKFVIVDRCRYRCFRSLRTQGFYSGKGPVSKRYTQGFYAGPPR